MTIRTCPSGLLWDNKHNTCNLHFLVNCIKGNKRALPWLENMLGLQGVRKRFLLRFQLKGGVHSGHPVDYVVVQNVDFLIGFLFFFIIILLFMTI